MTYVAVGVAVAGAGLEAQLCQKRCFLSRETTIDSIDSIEITHVVVVVVVVAVRHGECVLVKSGLSELVWGIWYEEGLRLEMEEGLGLSTADRLYGGWEASLLNTRAAASQAREQTASWMERVEVGSTPLRPFGHDVHRELRSAARQAWSS